MTMYAASYMVRKMDVKEDFIKAVWPMAVALAVVGYAARVGHRLSMGFRMLCGRRVEGAFALL